MTMTLSDAGVTFPDTSVQAKSAQGPAFSAYQTAAQSLPNSTFTKLNLGLEEFDTANAFDTTNSRFQPTVAGYYSLQGEVGMAATGLLVLALYKNGVEFKRGNQLNGNAIAVNSAFFVYLNGTTDYVELWIYQTTGGSVNTSAAAAFTYFSGFLARAA